MLKLCVYNYTHLNKYIQNFELSGMEKTVFENINWDKTGIVLAGLCGIHCILFPVLIALMPLWTLGLEVQHWIHPAFLALIIPTIVLALKKSNGNRMVSILLLTGITILTLACLLHSWIGHTAETIATLAGSGILVVGHWQNYKHHSALSCSTNNTYGTHFND